ncbi:CaiB/BaiF CoA transferase family protein [Acidisphaera rubrifaciens]|uniref:L-carnitine dehydratase/bile acid-inducible protein F n=1 Tax=Acidisphaera rubrifaciens HS-AP3 TaxID=1231350 RepID=A0A0D6P7V1_9PROT|nr:CaiB/BaiF CoA-transferase family protein [Acidisphaera rubrifaciens]GAN77421.1 L-carnitine dehydratase/bile acid-inducible protein F [Acidisphaera rubrifaciens HS-AP3]
MPDPATSVPATGPLARFRVLDLSRVRAGPTAVRQLSDWGASVIKIEGPEGDGGMGGDRHGPDFQHLHRNKRSLTLDLKRPEGLAVLHRLVARSDVLVENFRPGVKYRLGIDYERLRAVNPRLVYASISGFGQDGPYADRPGFDQIAQGMGGLMSITGIPGPDGARRPTRAGIPVADLTAGLYAALGILVALLEREVSGEGQWVQSSLLAAQIAMLDFQASRWLLGGEVPPQAGNDHPTSIPTGVFATADGHINIAASGDAIFRRLCDALGQPALATDPRFATGEARSDNRAALGEAIEAVTRTRPSAAWIETLAAASVPCGPINTIDQVFADPQVRHLRLTREVDHPRLGPQTLVGQPMELSRTPWSLRTPAPDAGADTTDVLHEIGYTSEEIARLRADGVI